MDTQKGLLFLFAVITACSGENFQGHRAAAVAPIPEFSLHPPFLDDRLTIPNWEFTGNTVVSDDFVRLTPDRQSKKGLLFNMNRFPNDSWEITFKFKVHGQGKSLYGDGFAFWYTKQRSQIGNVFGSRDHYVGLGVFFDTYSNDQGHHNHGHPYISALVNDGTVSYDHDADGTHQEIDGCQSFFRNVNFPTYVRITYHAASQTLTLLLDVKNKNEWETCFSVPDVYLPPSYYFGFSARTGDLADNHDIMEVEVSEPKVDVVGEKLAELKHPAQPEGSAPFAKHHAPERPHVTNAPSHHKAKSESSGWSFTIVLLLLFVGGAIGVVYYLKQKKQKEARFAF